MDDVEVGAADGFVVDLAALVTAVGTSDGCHIHAFFDEVSVEYRVPGGGGGLHEVAAFDNLRGGIDGLDLTAPLFGHLPAELAAMFLIRAVDFDLFELPFAAEKFEVGAG